MRSRRPKNYSLDFENYEKILNEHTSFYSNILNSYTETERRNIFRIVSESIENFNNLTPAEFKKKLKEIESAFDRLKKIFKSFTISTVPAVFNLVQEVNKNFFKYLSKKVDHTTRDIKALNTLIRDMILDFNTSADRGLESVLNYFKFNKSMQISESEISRLVANSILEKGTQTYYGKKYLYEDLKDNILDEKKFKEYIARKIRDKKKELSKLDLSEDDFIKKLKKYENKLKKEKFMQIIDKNGTIRNYSVKDYSDLVVRTRLGEAQVIGTIEQARVNDITLFQVTGHNTLTAICKPHEYKIYTTDKNNEKYEYLTIDRRPLYHPNCKHRLIPRFII